MNETHPSLLFGMLLAFVAGLVSFASPCVLPLVPGYIAQLSGNSIAQLQSGTGEINLRRVAVNSLAFILAFSVLFTLAGATATTIGGFLQAYQRQITLVAGIIVIIFGIHFLGIIRIPFLYYERRAQVAIKTPGVWPSVLMGLAFGFGWSPCIGPFLATVLLKASTYEHVGEGMLLLAVYSAGLGVPFFLTGLAMGRFLQVSTWLKRRMRAVEMAGGALLILFGVTMAFGWVTKLSSLLSNTAFGQWLLKVVPT